ncbi:hypothetical protein Tco_0408254 [Tanacetum coccineum]
MILLVQVMAISVYSISSISSGDSVGTPAGRVILFSTIPTTIPDTTPVITPPTTQTDTLSLIHLRIASSDHIPPLPDISPFLSSDDDPTDSDTPDTPSSPTHDTPFTEITASTQRSPIIPRRRVMLLAPGQPIPHGRPFRHQSASSDFHSDCFFNPFLRHPLSDHSSPDLPGTSAGPSCKRRRSLMTYVPALSHVSGALSPVRTNLIPSPKRIKDSGYLADESDPEIQAEIDECFAYADALRDRGIEPRVVVEADDQDETETGVRGPVEYRLRNETLGDLVSEGSMITSGYPGPSYTCYEEFRESRNTGLLGMKGENGGNGNGGNGGNRNGGNGENRNGNRNGNHGMNYGGFMPVARECTFQDFLKCKPHNFSGTEGVVGLTRWFEKMETVFNISNCPPKYQVKYATCILQDSALTWWNSHKRTIGVEAAYAMNWVGLMKLMTEVYCLRNEIQKMETEL